MSVVKCILVEARRCGLLFSRHYIISKVIVLYIYIYIIYSQSSISGFKTLAILAKDPLLVSGLFCLCVLRYFQLDDDPHGQYIQDEEPSSTNSYCIY